MANQIVYDPFSARLNKLINSFMTQPASFEEQQPVRLKVDVSETDQAYQVHADLPGVKKEDIRVDIDNNQVRISAEVKRFKEDKKDNNLIYSERYEGKVFRSFALEKPVDEGQAVAKYADGVLELTLPKKVESSVKRLNVE